jgi:Spy/CpxP family protein refolding chaperone
MAHLRFMLIVPVFALGILLVGCSDSNRVDSDHPGADGSGHAASENSRGIGSDGVWWRDEAILAELQLTDEQRNNIGELMKNAIQAGSQLRQRERRLSVSYLRALAQEPYDPELVDRVRDRLADVLSEGNRNRLEHLRGVRDILTQEQWTKLWEIAPRALQIGRIRVFRGPKVTVDPDFDGTPSPPPTP